MLHNLTVPYICKKWAKTTVIPDNVSSDQSVIMSYTILQKM